MFSKGKFSVLEAYKVSLRINYKHLLFYLFWYGIISVLTVLIAYIFLIYTHILNVSAMVQNYSWIISFFKDSFNNFFIGLNYKYAEFTEFSLYGFLKIFISEDILNSTLSSISLKEYINVVLVPLRYVLIPAILLWMSGVMTISIGYIKTALKFQNEQKAKLHDMYQYIYLLPQYFLGKMIFFLFFSFLVCLIGFVSFFILCLLPLNQNTQNGFVAIGIFFFVIALFAAVLLIYLWQRLRFIKYFIIDQEVSAFKACRLSWNLTKGSVISLFLFSLVTLLITVAHPKAGLLIMLSYWLNQQAEVNIYKQMVISKNT
ncbi:hypothetical protein HYV10_00525 [Candidatus Dependentiae bacterium]|nr:hypothetical protein [Candidatus Dependentiae bacterium]